MLGEFPHKTAVLCVRVDAGARDKVPIPTQLLLESQVLLRASVSPSKNEGTGC